MRRPASSNCQVAGCTVDLTTLRPYFLRQKICEEHAKAATIPDGRGGLVRFCQQCTKLEPVTAFEGTKRSCRASLIKRHDRHRLQWGKRVRSSRGGSGSGGKGSTKHARPTHSSSGSGQEGGSWRRPRRRVADTNSPGSLDSQTRTASATTSQPPALPLHHSHSLLAMADAAAIAAAAYDGPGSDGSASNATAGVLQAGSSEAAAGGGSGSVHMLLDNLRRVPGAAGGGMSEGAVPGHGFDLRAVFDASGAAQQQQQAEPAPLPCATASLAALLDSMPGRCNGAAAASAAAPGMAVQAALPDEGGGCAQAEGAAQLLQCVQMLQQLQEHVLLQLQGHVMQQLKGLMQGVGGSGFGGGLPAVAGLHGRQPQQQQACGGGNLLGELLAMLPIHAQQRQQEQQQQEQQQQHHAPLFEMQR